MAVHFAERILAALTDNQNQIENQSANKTLQVRIVFFLFRLEDFRDTHSFGIM